MVTSNSPRSRLIFQVVGFFSSGTEGPCGQKTTLFHRKPWQGRDCTQQCSPSLDDLLPEHDFQLFAVCARFPQNLAGQVALTPLRAGVYEVRVLTLRVRVIVVKELPRTEHNAMLLLFSARGELLVSTFTAGGTTEHSIPFLWRAVQAPCASCGVKLSSRAR